MIFRHHLLNLYIIHNDAKIFLGTTFSLICVLKLYWIYGLANISRALHTCTILNLPSPDVSETTSDSKL